MESKRKKRPVHRAVPVPPSKPLNLKSSVKSSVETLIKQNGDLIEDLLNHQGWVIVQELIDEGISSIVGRKTNGYYYFGELSRDLKSKDYSIGYHEGLAQLNNRIQDYIKVRDKTIEENKREESDKNAPVYNTFLEGEDNGQED